MGDPSGPIAVLNPDLLQATGSQLRIVATEFEHANARSNDAGDAVGHHHLSDKVEEFAHNWDDTRKKMLNNIAFLADAATGIGGNFEELDKSFVAALQGEGG